MLNGHMHTKNIRRGKGNAVERAGACPRYLTENECIDTIKWPFHKTFFVKEYVNIENTRRREIHRPIDDKTKLANKPLYYNLCIPQLECHQVSHLFRINLKYVLRLDCGTSNNNKSGQCEH